MSRSALIWLLAVAAGVTVANLYCSQPLLALMGAAFGAGAHETGLVSTLTQAGYAAGMLFIVPLGDSEERRRLLTLSCGAATLMLLAVALAPNLPLLLAASFGLGLATCTPQLLVPYAAGLVPLEERGRAIGKVMSGCWSGSCSPAPPAGWSARTSAGGPSTSSPFSPWPP